MIQNDGPTCTKPMMEMYVYTGKIKNVLFHRNYYYTFVRCRLPPWIVEILPGGHKHTFAGAKTRPHITSGSENSCLSVQTLKTFQADHCSVDGNFSLHSDQANACLQVFQQRDNHQVPQCLYICTQCRQCAKLCSGIGNNSKTCSASKVALFTHQDGPGRMKSKHDFIRRHAHSPDRVFKGLAKLIKKAHLLQWPSMRHRPGILWIVLIVSQWLRFCSEPQIKRCPYFGGSLI